MPRGDSLQTVKATLGLRQLLPEGTIRPGERLGPFGAAGEVIDKHGLTALFRSSTDAAARLHDDVARQDAERAIAGFHFFTFNDLLGTRRRQEERCAAAIP